MEKYFEVYSNSRNNDVYLKIFTNVNQVTDSMNY